MHDAARSGPIASWDSDAGRWLDANGMSGDLFGQSEPFSGTWPTSLTMLGGRLYPLPTPAHPTAGNGSSSSPGLLPTPRIGGSNRNSRVALTGANSDRHGRTPAGSASGLGLEQALEIARGEIPHELLPTPNETDGNGGPRKIPEARTSRGPDHGPRLRDVAPLLPTPTARTQDRSEEEAARRHLPGRAMGRNGGASPDLPSVVALLKTPTAQLATNGGSQHPDKRREGGHGPTLADQVECELLPTPAARERSEELLLPGVVLELLPTPTARLGDDTGRGADPARYKGPQSLNGRRSNLDDCIAAVETKAPWLPTGDPTAPRSSGGKPPPAARRPRQLSLDGLDSD